MKKSIYLPVLLILMSICGKSQFVPQTINYPNVPGIRFFPLYMSIVDANHAWLGTEAYKRSPSMDSTFTIAYKTDDGGDSWIPFTIPADSSTMCSVSAPTANIAYYSFYNYNSGLSSIWKTTDGGISWVKKTNAEFTGGYLNWCYAFTPDTLLAMGDPTAGYFEIYISNDGGDTWTRIPSENIPPPISNEIGLVGNCSVAGNTVWFVSSRGRCFQSTDHGWTWAMVYDSPPPSGWYYSALSTDSIGVVYDANDPFASNTIAVTTDGGANWKPVALDSTHYLSHISAVSGLDSAFILTVFDTTFSWISIWFTPDLFKTFTVIAKDFVQAPWMGTPAPGVLHFLDQSTGWLGGNGEGPDYIYKFDDILAKVQGQEVQENQPELYPNPSSLQSTLGIPANISDKELFIRIFDMSGRLLRETVAEPGTRTISIDASRYTSGIYIIELISKDQLISTHKWIIQH